jgi:hypothetical protein
VCARRTKKPLSLELSGKGEMRSEGEVARKPKPDVASRLRRMELHVDHDG